MNLIVAMSLAGSTAMLVYYLAGLILRKSFGAWGKDILLKAAMFFFLFPLPRIKYYLPFEMMELMQFFYHPDPGGVTRFGIFGYTAIPLEAGEYLILESWKLVYAAAGVCVALGFIGYQAVRYFRLKRLLGVCTKDVSQEVFENNPKLRELCGKKQVRILTMSEIRTPFTLGVLHPVIFLPEQDFTQEELKLVLFHETAHIKRRDILMKWIGLLIVLLHWFNPFSYLMLREINKVSEYRCDEEALRIAGAEKSGAYARLIVCAAAAGTKKTKLWASSLSGSKKDISKRVETIMDRRRMKKGLGIAVVAFAAALSSFGSTYAYEQEQTWRSCDKPEAGEEIVFIPDTDESGDTAGYIDEYFEMPELPSVDFTCSDTVFIEDATGKVFYLDEDELMTESERACIHTYKDGRKAIHKRDGKGGCEVLIYKTKKCIKCDYVIVGEFINSVKYAECPH